MSQTSCRQCNSCRTSLPGSSFIKIRKPEHELRILICSACRCLYKFAPDIELKPISLRHSRFPATGSIGKNVYGITVILVLCHLDFRFSHTEHILPIVHYIFHLVAVVVYHPEFQIGHDGIGSQCLPQTCVTGTQSLCDADDVFMIPFQRQIAYLFSLLAGLSKVNPVESRRTVIYLPFHNQANSLLAAHIIIFRHTAGIHCRSSFEGVATGR